MFVHFKWNYQVLIPKVGGSNAEVAKMTQKSQKKSKGVWGLYFCVVPALYLGSAGVFRALLLAL